MPEDKKQCVSCLDTKELSLFPKNNKYKDKHDIKCKKCRGIETKLRRFHNEQYFASLRKERK